MSLPDARGRISIGRKWTAIAVATLLLTASFWAMQVALGSWLDLTEEQQAQQEQGARIPMTATEQLGLGGGLALVPAGLAALALISRRERPLRAVAVACLLTVTAAVLLSFLLGEPVTPMVAGFGAGGVMALRAEPEHTIGRRAIAALLISVYVFVLLRISLLAGFIVAPMLPLPAIAWADAIADQRAAGGPMEPRKPLRRPGR